MEIINHDPNKGKPGNGKRKKKTWKNRHGKDEPGKKERKVKPFNFFHIVCRFPLSGLRAVQFIAELFVAINPNLGADTNLGFC